MLREHLRSGALDRPVVEFFDDNRPVFREGQLVAGRYRIVRFIGRGGMGEVYEAEDHDLNERIAVKTLLPAIAGDARMVARFKQEIQLSRKIGHPNVCRVFDLARETVEASEKAVVFLTMEFLDGETLETRICRDGPLPSAAALPILEQMSQGLNAAHRAGILHRDLKPSNVMLVPRAVITDFGLASSFSVSGDTAPTITAPLMGTLDYMAPELLKNQHPSVSSDIYALGMVAYKTVTGSLPFASDPPLAAAILRSRMPVPGPRALVPDLDPAWDRAILRALDADPSRRFSNAGAFAAALRGESSALTLPLPVLTRRRVIGGGIAAAALAAAGISWPMLARLRNRPPAEALRFYHIGVDDIHAGAYFAATKALSEAVRLTPHFSLAHARLAEAWNALDLTETASQEMLLARRQDLSGLSRPDRLQVEAIDLTITREFDSAVTKCEQMRRYFDPADAGFQLDLGRAYENAALPQRAIEAFAAYIKRPDLQKLQRPLFAAFTANHN